MKRDLQVLPVTLLSLFLQPETDTGLSLGFDASIAKALAPPASRQLPRGSHRPWAACRQRPVELGGGKRLISLGRLLRRRLPHIWPGAAHDLAELKPLLLRQAVLSRDLGGVLGLERLRQRPQRARLLFSSPPRGEGRWGAPVEAFLPGLALLRVPGLIHPLDLDLEEAWHARLHHQAEPQEQLPHAVVALGNKKKVIQTDRDLLT